MRDYVAVNLSTIYRLEETWGVVLNELNCHIHPLDMSTLKNVETISRKLFGTDCLTGNIVLAVNKVRYKDGAGDPKGFVAGPWMTKFYSAGWSQSVSHVDGIQVVKRVVDRIRSIIQMPMDTPEMKTDFFDRNQQTN